MYQNLLRGRQTYEGRRIVSRLIDSIE